MTVDQVNGLIRLEDILQDVRNALTGQVMPVTREGSRYADGLKTGHDADHITIGVNNVWGGRTTKYGYAGCISSNERIGYHSGSVDFITGVLDSGCPVYAYRRDDGGIVRLYRLEG